MKHDLLPARLLTAEIQPLGIVLDSAALDLLARYWDLLHMSVGTINLISPKTLEDGPIRHLADSLLGLLSPATEGTATILDIGSGGGLPGLPLAITRPHSRVSLLESRTRKAEWLERTVRELGLSERVDVIGARFESLAPEEVARYSCLTVRALAPPESLLPRLLPLLGPRAVLLLWHSPAQRNGLKGVLREPAGEHAFTLYNTYSHVFVSNEFSSCVSEIGEVR